MLALIKDSFKRATSVLKLPYKMYDKFCHLVFFEALVRLINYAKLKLQQKFISENAFVG